MPLPFRHRNRQAALEAPRRRQPGPSPPRQPMPDLPISRNARRSARLCPCGGDCRPAPPSDLVGVSPGPLAGWFDDAMDGQIPEVDGALCAAHRLTALPDHHRHRDLHTSTETFRGLDRLSNHTGPDPKPEAAAKIDILRERLAPIGKDLPGLRGRALLLLGFAGPSGARSSPGSISSISSRASTGCASPCPSPRATRRRRASRSASPFVSNARYRVRAMQRRLAAASITDCPAFRRV